VTRSSRRRPLAVLAVSCVALASSAVEPRSVAGYVPPPLAYQFTGPSALGTPTITQTGGSTEVPPSFANDSTPLTSTDTPDGFSVTGSLNFFNGTATSVEVQFTASRPVTLYGFPVTVSSYLNGDFSAMPSDPTLDVFSARTSLATASATASVSNLAIPFVDQGTLTAQDGPVFSAPFAPTGSFDLTQAVDIKISNLDPFEEVFITLPTTSAIQVAAVPEPAGVVLLGVGGLALGAAWLRRRGG
jgi:hypothetical protein